MKFVRYLLFPFAIIYWCITSLRNFLYQTNLLPSYQIPIKSICVGNLSVGGTGKTPHIAYLANLLSADHETAILSRGYGRTTKGFRWVNANDDAEQVGDEPLFFANTLKKVAHFAVAEKRVLGVQKILNSHPSTSLILLDDAFQHRAVKASLNIVLTDFNSPYFNDFHLPTGDLREDKKNCKRADYVIVTKCPLNISNETKEKYLKKLNFDPDKIYFSSIKYGELACFGKGKESFKKILLVSGIANPKPLFNYLSECFEVESLFFPDHYAFKKEDIAKIHQKISKFESEMIVVCTEKDFMRLKNHLDDWDLKSFPWYYQPITVAIDKEEEFNSKIKRYVNTLS